MRYWWASQGKNYKHVAHTGNLWTCPSASGRSRPDRKLIQELAPGDLVFHYARMELRALSKVTAAWVHWPRPEHYPAKPGERNDGWLVETEPVVLDLETPLGALTEVVSHGSPGPLDVNGRPMQKYLSELEPGDAIALLQLIGVDVAQDEDGSAKADDGQVWRGTNTSVMRDFLARCEQAALRKHLLGGRFRASCDLCGRELPAELLVAAHIVPRHRLTDDERRNLSRIAMLACTLGCDALFEHGYLAVDSTGTVQAFSDQQAPNLTAFMQTVAGQRCTAYTPATAGRFADHYSRALSRRREGSVRR